MIILTENVPRLHKAVDQIAVEDPPAFVGADALDLDVRIVEEGAAVNALLCTTDNGCDTRKDGDC
jgi:FxLD family lantipeptide